MVHDFHLVRCSQLVDINSYSHLLTGIFGPSLVFLGQTNFFFVSRRMNFEWLQLNTSKPKKKFRKIVKCGGLIFMYLCLELLTSFEIDCFHFF